MRSRSRCLAALAAVTLSACSAEVITRPSDITSGGTARTDVATAAVDQTILVTESDIVRQPENTPPAGTWVLYTRLAGTGAFRIGPTTPPLGLGSIEFATPTGADKVTLFNYEQVGTPLSEVSSMSYSTFRTAGALQQVAALNIQVDHNGPAAPGGFTTLVFEPVYNPSQGPVVSGVWQSWDAYQGGNAMWWSTQPIPGAQSTNFRVSWNDIVALNPNAYILGGFGVNEGSGNPALVTAVDALHFDTPNRSVTWNFEPFRVPTSGDDCKKYGWQNLRRTDGTTFKNQGDCVSYGNTGR